MECQKQKNLKNCACTYPGCPRKGICCECVKYHRENKGVPACFFSEKAEKKFDRSVKKFIEDNS